jgi:hypothetical protein
MKNALAALTLVAVLSAAPAQAQSFDPSQCARIQDVDVPYRVSVAQDATTFSSREGDITVSAISISASGRVHQSAAVAMYHQHLRRFLSQADTMGREGLRAANPFARRGAELGDVATGMCQAIIDLAGSSATIEGEFRGYRSPVRIQLR